MNNYLGELHPAIHQSGRQFHSDKENCTVEIKGELITLLRIAGGEANKGVRTVGRTFFRRGLESELRFKD